MIKPQNQTQNPAVPKRVLVGYRSDANDRAQQCEVTEAIDVDTWDYDGEPCTDDTCTDNDEVTYEWKTGGGATFQNPTDPGKPYIVKTRTATWLAPLYAVGNFTLTCTINDNPKDIENPPESGRRDDPKIERQVVITMVSIDLDPNRPVVREGDTVEYHVTIQPADVAWQDITFEVASGGDNVEIVKWDGSTLTIKGLDEGPIRIVAKSGETDSVLGSFSGKVLGANATDDEIFQNQWGDPSKDDPPLVPLRTQIWNPRPPVQGGEIVSPEGGVKTIQPGESIDLKVALATDVDSWVSREVNGDIGGQDTADVDYMWTDQDKNPLTPDPNDKNILHWTAPSEEGTYYITCTLVDEEITVSNGSRDDDDIVRNFIIQVQEKEPDIDTGDNIRACAGHIDDGVHKATIHLIAKDKDTGNFIAAKLHLSFEGNKGSEDAKRAKFIVDGEEVEEATVTTNADTGKADITVISSDVVSNSIKVKVEWKDSQDNYKDVGSVTCDFGAVESKRRFGIKPFADDTQEGADKDNGWTAIVEENPSQNFFTGTGQVCAMTVYVKFRKSLSIPIDTQYFTTNGTPNDQNLTDKDNWLAVPDHQLRVSFAGIGKRASIHSAYAARDDSPLYVYFVSSAGNLIDKDGNELHDAQGNPVSSPSQLPSYQPPEFVNVTTGGNGTATVYVKSGPLINNVVYFGLKAEDQTQRQQ